MKQEGLRSKTVKKWKATTNSRYNLLIAPNCMNREFIVVKPNEKMVSDITYIWTAEGWLYVAGIMDLYGQKIVGWSCGDRMTKELVVYCVE